MESTVSPVAQMLISLVYSIYAGRIVFYTRWAKVSKKEGFTLFSHIFVFVFCALSGYASVYFPDSMQHLRDPLHWALLCCAMIMAFSDHPLTMARMAERNTRADSR